MLNNLNANIKFARQDYECMVYEKLIKTVDAALENMKEAKMGHGKGFSYINSNRTAEYNFEAEDGTIHTYVSQGPNNSAPVDRTVFVMEIEDDSGKQMALFVNYTVHCCTMYLNHYDEKGSMGISGDIAGNVSKYLEGKSPESVAIWSSGVAGNVTTIIVNEVFYANPKDGARELYMFPSYRL